MKAIMAAVDLGPGADLVVEGAAALARGFAAELHIVHVAEGGTAGSERREEALRGLVGRAAAHHPVATQHVIRGRPANAIVDHARTVGASLIVLGPHSGGDLGARVLGTTADRVVRDAGIPCLVLRAPLQLPLRSLAAATDFSAAALHAARTAVAWARALGETSAPPTLTLLHAGWPPDRLEDTDAEETTLLGRVVAVQQRLADEADEAPAMRAHVLWSTKASDAIAEWTTRHGTGLLVLGTTGDAAVRRMLGSVAGSLARRASCPVLLVPFGSAAAERPSSPPALECVVTGIDLSPASVAAAEWVCTELAPRARHVFVHVVEPPDRVEYASDGADMRVQLLARAREDGALRMDRLLPDAAAERRVVVGRPADELIRAADDAAADILVVGGTPHPRGLWAALGTTAEHLVRVSTIPVLIVRGRPVAAPRHVVACVDDSADADGVLHWADTLARQADATLEVVHVHNPRFVGAAQMVSGMAAARDMEEVQLSQAETWLHNRVQRAGLDPDAYRITVVTGDPAWEVLALEQRRRAGLLVLGSRGAGAISRTLIGSVAYAVVRGASCPVLVVRGGRDGT